jgi:hypothetical protein
MQKKISVNMKVGFKRFTKKLFPLSSCILDCDACAQALHHEGSFGLSIFQTEVRNAWKKTMHVAVDCFVSVQWGI